MLIFYLIPAAILWAIYAICWFVGAPWWIDYPVFGAACASTAVGLFIAGLSTVGPRF